MSTTTNPISEEVINSSLNKTSPPSEKTTLENKNAGRISKLFNYFSPREIITKNDDDDKKLSSKSIVSIPTQTLPSPEQKCDEINPTSTNSKTNNLKTNQQPPSKFKFYSKALIVTAFLVSSIAIGYFAAKMKS